MSVNNMRHYRKKQGMTQEELATKLNVCKSWVSLKETGKRGVNIDEAKQIAEALNVPVKKIFFAQEVCKMQTKGEWK